MQDASARENGEVHCLMMLPVLSLEGRLVKILGKMVVDSFIFDGQMLLHEYPISKVCRSLKISVCAGFFHCCLTSL